MESTKSFAKSKRSRASVWSERRFLGSIRDPTNVRMALEKASMDDDKIAVNLAAKRSRKKVFAHTHRSHFF